MRTLFRASRGTYLLSTSDWARFNLYCCERVVSPPNNEPVTFPAYASTNLHLSQEQVGVPRSWTQHTGPCEDSNSRYWDHESTILLLSYTCLYDPWREEGIGHICATYIQELTTGNRDNTDHCTYGTR